MYQAVLADARFHHQLLAFDQDLSEVTRAAGCKPCGGKLHSARFSRKPRGVPLGLDEQYRRRFSFCCAVDGCRARATPASLRFLGRKVWLATVVTLITAMQQGATAGRARQLSTTLGIDRHTLSRWRRWWLATFAGPFRPLAQAAFMPPLDLTGVPATLLARFGGDLAAQLVSTLRFLRPLTGGRVTMHAL